MDLRELQQSGRIGRIKVELQSEGGKSQGIITIPCSLDRTETAILAAAIETVDRVGPCSAKITLEKVEDVREEKRKRIIDRAIDLLRDWEGEVSPDSQEMTDAVFRESRTADITKYGKEGLPAGPEIAGADSIIVVEGRADVLALLRVGIKNVIAVEGTNIPKSIIELAKKKKVITFLDGDRGGDLILKELGQVAKIDFVARAPKGREVEELSHKEIVKALRHQVPAAQVQEKPRRKVKAVKETKAPSKTRRRPRRTTPKPKATQRSSARRASQVRTTRKAISKPKKISVPEPVKKAAAKIQQTMMAVILDEDYKRLKEIHVGEVANELQKLKKAKALLLDGVITQRLIDIAEERKIELIVGVRVGNIVKKPAHIEIHTFNEM